MLKWQCGAPEEMLRKGREINMGQSKGSRQEAWVLSGWHISFVGSVCLPLTQPVRVTERRVLAPAREVSLDSVAPWPCLCKARV